MDSSFLNNYSGDFTSHHDGHFMPRHVLQKISAYNLLAIAAERAFLDGGAE